LTEQGFLSGELLDGKYRIEKLLGQGGMGAVYRATHLGTKRTVAIKVIHPQFSNNAEFVERFRREAEATGRLRHPNVVDVTDFGFAQTSAGQVAYLVMEYLDGCTLAEVLDEEQRLPRDWVVDILEQVCSAVEEAHRLGIIHRDLKPENIWLEPNRRGGYTVKVLDFGLVKLGALALPEIEGARSITSSSAAPAATATAPEMLRADAGEAETGSESAITESPTLIQSPAVEEAATLIQKPFDSASVQASSAGKSPPRGSPVSFKDAQTQILATPATGAKVAVEKSGADRLTRVGSVMGTPLYMSPEQCRGEVVNARSDIYSLGVIAYRMLAGETPFTGSFDELVRLHHTSQPQSIREKNRKVPKRMARLVMSALAKDPAERPESAAGFASALRASAEGSGTLLRHAFSLYSERSPTFLKISLLAYAPLMLVIGLMALGDKIFQEYFSGISGQLLGLGIFAVNLVINVLAYALVSAITVPIVIQLMIAPLRQVRVRTALKALKPRWWVFSLATILVTTMILGGTVLLVIPGMVAAVCYALYAPVIVMEKSGVRATLKRARQLLKRSWSTALVITLLQFTLPIAVWLVSANPSFTLRLAEDWSPKEFGFHFSFSAQSLLYQLLNIFITPLTAIMTAMLYLKTRQAGGENVKGAIEQFDAQEMPRSKWQARMRSRSQV
jgi:serine/threonine protein kinase